jgi:hypothetical protein
MDRIIATQMPLPRQHFPTYEEYGPVWGHVWVDVQNIKNLAPEGSPLGRIVQNIKNLAPEGSPLGRIINPDLLKSYIAEVFLIL